MRGTLIRPTLVALAIVGVLLVAGGIAYATIPDSSGVIHACYKVDPKGNLDSNATLRVIDPGATKPDSAACKKDEQALDWNQAGQQGQQGPPGPTGPSDVWSVDGYNAPFKNVAVVPASVNLATTSTLPAGSYFVQAETEAEDFLSVTNDYFCDLVDSSNNVYQETRVTGPNTVTDWVTIPVQAVVTLASPATISLSCDATGPGSQAFNWQLAAIKIGTVHS
jgi:hypothetical protein